MVIRLIGYMVMGVVFLSVVALSVEQLMRWKLKNDFFGDVQKLACLINAMADQDVNSRYDLSIRVPPGGIVSADNRRLSACCQQENLSFELRCPVSSFVIREGEYLVSLRRREEGVDVHASRK